MPYSTPLAPKAYRSALLLGAAACLLLPPAFAQSTPTPESQPPQAPQTSQAAQALNKVSDAQVEANVLKALAGAPDLANQPVTSNTTYGVVTLSGSVATEALRTEVENIVSRTAGVQKVVDELTLSSSAAVAQNGVPEGSQLPVAQGNNAPPNDGNLAPVPQGSPDSDNTGSAPQQPPTPQSPPLSAGPSYGPGAPEYHQPYGSPQPQSYPQQNYPQQAQQPYPQQNQQPYPQQGQNYPQAGYPQYPQQQPYPQAQQYPQQRQPYPQQQPYGYPGQQPYPQQGAYNQAPYSGQQPGQPVTIPAGALLRIRINQPLDSGRTPSGTTFDGTVVSDIVADGAIAIPRGATVQGTVVDAKRSGVLAGRGELALQLTHVTLGGQIYAITSDVWAHNGGDKTTQTVNSTAIGAGLGAVIGAVAGGGPGAAIGAGVGGGLGLGSSAASGSGQVYIPAEGMLTFHLTQPVTVATLSQVEMDRLAHATPAGPGVPPPPMRRRVIYPYPYPYYGPVYPYPRYYYPYRY